MSSNDKERLEKIDRLYDLRLDQYVNLPQLVVVGDQSSGKSSVLEALTGIPFPRNAGLCTRFPTQVVFKRSRDVSIDVNVNRSLHGSVERNHAHQPFEKRHYESIEDMDFVDVLEKASSSMGLLTKEPGESAGQPSFSQDMLKIEISGPHHEHFSVVDLPGLFRTSTPGVTTKEDIPLVRNMVLPFLKSPRSIIVAVVSANIDIATQEIVQMAEEADPRKLRTLAVLTKPDLVDKGAEQGLIDLVVNSSKEKGLGYSILCNRGQSELKSSIEKRNAKEKAFFSAVPWNKIPSDRFGIAAFKSRLDQLLVTTTRGSFHSVASELREEIRKKECILEQYGAARDSAHQQRNHLLKLMTTFQNLAARALDAQYSRESCFSEKKELCLASLIAFANATFSEKIYQQGHTRDLDVPGHQSESTNNESEIIRSPEFEPPSLAPDDEDDDNDDDDSNLGQSFIEIKDLLERPKLPISEKNSNIMDWIRERHLACRGFQIAMIDSSFLSLLFAEQARNWRFYAIEHVQSVVKIVHNFIKVLLDHVCADIQIRNGLWSRLFPGLRERYQKAIANVQRLCNVEQSGRLITTNDYYHENYRKAQLARIRSRFLALPSWTTDDKAGHCGEPLLRFNDVLQVCEANRNDEIEKIHDMLGAYYKVALKRFRDAICTEVIDTDLVSGEKGPVQSCSSEFIGQLSDKDLEEIAGESLQTIRDREQLSVELKNMKLGLAILCA